MLLSIGIPFAARAGAPATADRTAHAQIPFATGTASPATAAPSLTLFADPNLKGRRITYRTASIGVERQGFAARSASSVGVWTMCEGGEVASRCQTVDGQIPELRFSPQIVRPGVNALALYAQPGLKGLRVIYSFPADRPAPFHARSARTWGGPWSLCERGFHHCQTLEGSSQDLDLVVAAVRPEPVAAGVQSAAFAVASAPADKQAPAAVRPKPVKSPSPVHSPHPPRLVRVDAAHTVTHKRPAPPRRATVEHAAFEQPRHAYERSRQAQRSHAWSGHAVRADRFVPPPRYFRTFRSVRFDHVARRPMPAHLVRRIAERHSRHAHAAHRRLYRRVRMYWGGPDPYLHDAEPREFGPPGGW